MAFSIRRYGEPMQKLADLWRGVISQPRKLATQVFSSFGMAFTVVKAITHFFPSSKIDGIYPLALILFGCLIYGLVEVWKPSETRIEIANCDTVIEVVFGER
jgi:hypothetical protein